MLRIPPEGDFRANFSLGGTAKKAELTSEMKALAEKAAKASNAVFAGVDIVYAEDKKPYLLEVNRTPGFQGFMQSHDIDIPKKFAEYIKKMANN
jgi:glutathione synthase/RimK-type ligase-like ATP-grasp enzyme